MTSSSWWSTRTTHGRTQSLPRSWVPTPHLEGTGPCSPGLMAWPAKPPPTSRELAPALPWLPLPSRCSAVQGGGMRVQDVTFTKVTISEESFRRVKCLITHILTSLSQWRSERVWYHLPLTHTRAGLLLHRLHKYQGCNVCFFTTKTKDLDHTTCILGKSSDVLAS